MSAPRHETRWVRPAALASAALLALSTLPRGRDVNAQAPPERSAEPTPFLALTAEEIAALPVAPAPGPGPDPRLWREIAPATAGRRHVEAWPGADLLLRGDATHLEALLWFAPGADPSAFELTIPDATAFETAGSGHAIVRAPGGDVVLLRPGLHQETASGRQPVVGGWQDRGEGRVGLARAELDPAAPLAVGFRVLLLPEASPALDRNRDGRVTLDELVPSAQTPEGSPSITATKRDTLVVDNDSDGQADPGDTLRYDIVIGNAGTDATTVQLADPLDPNLTLVPGSINVSPLALDDTYEAIGHVTLSVTNPLQGLFANDTEFLGDTFTLTSPAPGVPTPTANGGTATVNADGTFTYSSAAGSSVTPDTFTYVITDGGGLTGTATVTFNIAGLVWFIDRDAAPGGTGTQASPFDELADVNGAGGAGDPDAPSHVIYLHDRVAPTDYVNGLELEAGQRLVGSGVALVVGTTTVLPATTPPTIEHTGGNALTLASDVTIEGVTVNAANDAAIAGTGALGTVAVNDVTLATSAGGAGVSLSNQGGTFTMASSSVTGNGTGAALLLSTGAGSVNLAGAAINKTAGRLVDVQGKTGGSVSLGGVTGTGAATDAIVLQNNTGGSTVSFGSGFSVTTTTGRGLLADNSGTVTIGGTASTIAATGGAALDLTNTSFGGTATFASVSSTSSTAHGIRLDTVGGALQVNGGSITNPGTQGILIQGSSLNATFNPGAQVSGTGTQRILLTTSTGNIAFGNTTLSGGTDGVSLQGNPGGSRTFGTLSIGGNTGVGFFHAAGGGATSVTGATTITNPGGTGVDIQNSAAAVSFNGVTVNKGATSGTGVNLASNTAAPSFGTLSVTTSAGAGLLVSASGVTTTGGAISATSGPAVGASSAAFSATFSSVSSTNSPVQGISLVTSSGTLTMTGGSITGAAGTAFHVNGGNPTVTYAGSVTQNSAQRLLDLQNTTGGSVSLATATGGASSTGVNVSAANGNLTFTTLNLGTSGSRMTNQAVTISGGTGTYHLGTVGIFTTGATAKGISAVNADGTLNATTGAVDAAGAPAVDLDGPAGLTTLGVTLTRVAASGGSYGLSLQDTNGSFTVAGDGGGANNGSGGVISSMTGADMTGAFEQRGNGVYLRNATNVSLGYLNVTGCQNNGIFGDDVTGFTLNRSNITNHGNNVPLLEAPVRFHELLGAAAITNSTVSGGHESNVLLTPASGVLSNLAITNSTIGPTNAVSPGNDGIAILPTGSASMTLNVTGTSFPGNRSAAVNVLGSNTSQVTLNVSGSTVQGSGGVNQAFAFSLATSQDADVTYNLSNNTTINGSTSNAFNILTDASAPTGATANSLHRGQIRNNVVGNGTPDSGSQTAFGIALDMRNDQDAVVEVTGNTISNTDIDGIFAESADFALPDATAGLFDLTVRNNLVNTPDDNSAFPFLEVPGVRVESRHDTNLCFDINGNDSAQVGSVFGDFRTRQRDTSQHRVERLALGAQTAATMATFVAGQNVGGSTATATAATSYTGVADGVCRTVP